MPKKTLMDLTGQRFGKLVAIRKDMEASCTRGNTYWLCVCDCGKYRSIKYSHLLSGNSKSCGCMKMRKKKVAAIDIPEPTSPDFYKPVDKSKFEHEHADDWMFHDDIPHRKKYNH